MKACNRCGETKDLSEFHRAAGARDGHRGECKVCARLLRRENYEKNREIYIERARLWVRENPDRARATRKRRNARPEVKRSARDAYYRRTYGVSADEFDAMLEAQGGRCAICKEMPERLASMHVDHDHATGEVRGLLCLNCNQGIGKLKDDASLLLRAAFYLRHATTPLLETTAG
jgi:hypothetical protein